MSNEARLGTYEARADTLLLECPPKPGLTNDVLLANSVLNPQPTGPCVRCEGHGLAYALFKEGRLSVAPRSQEDGQGYDILSGHCADCYREYVFYELLDQLETARHAIAAVRSIGVLRSPRERSEPSQSSSPLRRDPHTRGGGTAPSSRRTGVVTELE